MNSQKTYTYPDGTQGTSRPKDGQIFTTFDLGGNPQTTWQWDDFIGQWFNVSTGKFNQQNTATFVVPNNAITPEDVEELQKALSVGTYLKPSPACECGAKHTEFPQIHLRFCPLYT